MTRIQFWQGYLLSGDICSSRIKPWREGRTFKKIAPAHSIERLKEVFIAKVGGTHHRVEVSRSPFLILNPGGNGKWIASGGYLLGNEKLMLLLLARLMIWIGATPFRDFFLFFLSILFFFSFIKIGSQINSGMSIGFGCLWKSCVFGWVIFLVLVK